jgi:hypothetical protein
MRILVISVALLTVIIASGCATVVRGPNQEVRVNAYEAATNNIVPADCFLSNDEELVYTKSNKSVLVGRDKDPMTVLCHTDKLGGKSVVAGEVNAGFVAVDFFVIDLCIISCWIDGLSGSWAQYPDIMDVALTQKDESYYKMIKEKSAQLKQIIAKQSKDGEEYSAALSDPNDPSHYRAVESKKKLEEAQLALKMIEKGLLPPR